MTHLLFFLWMLLYPIFSTAELYLDILISKKRQVEVTEKDLALTGLFHLIIYLVVGYLLYTQK